MPLFDKERISHGRKSERRLKEGDSTVIDQSKFFAGLGFEPFEMEYPFGKETCYKGSDGGFYRVDHFSDVYVIEYAENEEEARLNRFEDDDLYDDSLPEEVLIAKIQADLKEYVTQI